MGDKGRSNLVVNERGSDVNWFSGGQNLYNHRLWHRSKNHVEQKFDLNPESGSTLAYANTAVFEVDKRGDLWMETGYIKKRGPLTVSEGAPTFFRFPDWEAYEEIKEVRVVYNNKPVFSISGHEMLKQYLEELPREERDTYAALALGEKTQAERALLAAADNVVTVAKLRLPWRKVSKGIVMNALPNKVRVEVELNKLADIVETNGTASSAACSVKSAILKCQFIHQKQTDRTEFFNRVHAGRGIIYKMSTTEMHLKEAIPIGTTKHPVRLRNIKNAVYKFQIALRDANKVDTAATRNALDFRLPSRCYLQDNSTPVSDAIEFENTVGGFNYGSTVDKTAIHPNHKKSIKTFNLVFCPRHLAEKSEDDCFGSRNIVSIKFYYVLQVLLTFCQTILVLFLSPFPSCIVRSSSLCSLSCIHVCCLPCQLR